MKQTLSITFVMLLSFALITIHVNAATIILRSGATVKGKLIDRTDDEITIQDPETKQMRVIKSIFVRDLVLERDEQKLVEKLEKKRKKGKDLKLRGGDDDEALLRDIQPTIGIMPGIALPVGKLASKVQLGYGALLFADTGIPMKPEIFKVRFGLSVGFLYHQTKSTKASSSIMMLPIVAYTKLQFITPVGVRPYIKLGGGITPVMGGGTSMDPTFAASVGLGYVNGKIPFMEFFFDAGFMMAFEKVRGDFVTVNLGVAYHFGAPPASTGKVEEKKK